MNAQEIARYTPYLRRYARALIGLQSSGDDFVQATLESLADGRQELDPGLPTKTALFKAFHACWRRSLNGHSIDAPNHSVDRRLAQLTPEHRTALLLVMMEGFSLREVGQILGLEEQRVRARFADAEAAIERQLSTQVLIIEDEPIVALDLKRLVCNLGHTVVGVAGTRREAMALAGGRDLGLILADVRLADGANGIDVVSDILRTFDVPVIFITAFPERLLTGEKREPAFLVAKPFQDSMVKALIGQALFFHESRA
jgi:DNA-directed RNA polymerase specialized sigma24 family protein/CheY-like chemotaxis protein